MSSPTLKLTLKKDAFDCMKTGEKTREFRKPSDWIKSRLVSRNYKYVEFRNGYADTMPSFTCHYLGYEIATRAERIVYSTITVFVEPGDYIIKLGEITQSKNL